MIKFIIMLAIVAFTTVKAITMVSGNTSDVITNHHIATANAIEDATR